MSENDNAQSETDDNETDNETDIITNEKSNDSTLHPIQGNGSRHIQQFSNQTDCKLQQPISPILDAFEPENIVQNIVNKAQTHTQTPKLEQSSPLSVIDQDGNEVLPLVRNQSRNITTNDEERRANITSLRTQSIAVQKQKQYKRGSIDNIRQSSHKKRKKFTVASDSNSQSRSVSKHSSDNNSKSE